MFEELLHAASENVRVHMPVSDGDYMQDGLLYCGVCHTPRQTRVSLPGREMTVYCTCQCRREARDRAEQARAEAARRDRIRALRAEAFDSPALRECTFARDDSPDTFVSRVCRRYADRFDEMGNKGLLLFGGVGAGKSFYAACIANALLDRGVPCRMTTLSALAKERELPDKYRVIILDDFGTQRDTEYMREAVWSIVDTLYRRRTVLLCTTNLTAQELKTAADVHTQRILSRLYEMCMFYEVPGKDRRRERMKSDNAAYKAILESKAV